MSTILARNPPHSRSAWRGRFDLAWVAAAAAGCAAGPAEHARHAYVEAQTHTHVYRAPCDRLRDAAQRVLTDHGFRPTTTATAEGFVVDTDWHQAPPFAGKPPPSGLMRCQFRGVAPEPGACRVEALHTLQGGEPTRDADLEWELLRREDPPAARQIEAGGEQAARQTSQARSVPPR